MFYPKPLIHPPEHSQAPKAKYVFRLKYMLSTTHRNQDATVYVGNLDDRVDDALLWELFTQVGRVVRIYMPKDKVLNKHKNIGFVEFRTEADAEYAQLIMNMVKLFDRPIRVSQSSTDGPGKRIDVGANLFIGNISPEVDDKILHDTFSAFGRLVDSAHVERDDQTGRSLSYGFAAYANFEAADTAIQAMNGQFLCGRMINVQYAFKKDASKKGTRERHGSAAERLLASSTADTQKRTFKPHTHFSTGPNAVPILGGMSNRQMGMPRPGINGMHGMPGTGRIGGMPGMLGMPGRPGIPMRGMSGMPMRGMPGMPMLGMPVLGGMSGMMPPQLMMMQGGIGSGMAPPGIMMPILSGMAPPPPPPPPSMMNNLPPSSMMMGSGPPPLPPPPPPPPPMFQGQPPPQYNTHPNGLPPPLPPPPPPT